MLVPAGLVLADGSSSVQWMGDEFPYPGDSNGSFQNLIGFYCRTAGHPYRSDCIADTSLPPAVLVFF